MGTSRGVALFRPVTGDFTVFNEENSGLPNGLVFSILRTSDDRLLVGVEMNGIWAYDLKATDRDQRFKPLKETQEMPSITIYDMIEDSFGNIWAGGYGGGLFFIGHEKPVFNTLSYPEKLPERIVRGLDFDRNDQLMVAMEGSEAVLFDSSFASSEAARMEHKDNLSLFVDSRGFSWVGALNGQVSILDRNLMVISYIPIMAARAFFESGNYVWVTSGSGGLYSVDKNTFKVIQRYSRGFLPDSFMRAVAEDDEGNLWAGSFRSGLFIFKPDMSGYINFNTSNGFPSDGINHIMKDRNGNMWISSGNGLICFKAGHKNEWDRIALEEFGLSSENVKATAEAPDGSIWFSTTMSICHLDRNGKVSEYGKRYGISSGDFSEGAVATRSDGLIAFGSTSGVTYFDPERIKDEAEDIPVHLSKLFIFNSADPITGQYSEVFLPGKEKVVLNSYQNNIRLSFAVDDHSLAPDTEYSYRIVGFNNKWYISDGNSISINDMHPGRYSLQVRAKTFGGIWSEVTDSVDITIKPPFYATKLAFTLYAILIFALALTIINLILSKRYANASLREARELDEEKLRFYTNITHELKTPLSLIMGPAEDILKDSGLSPESRAKMEMVYKNSSKILDLITQFLNFRKMETDNFDFNPSYGDLSSFTRGIGDIFAESRINRNVSFNMDISDGIFLDFDHRIMNSILNNLLSNAMKYTSSGDVSLSLKAMGEGERRKAVISVKDTGIGIEKDNLPKIFERYYQVPGKHQASGVGIGLSLVKNLVEIHGGEISVTSEIGQGSTFTVQFPYPPSILDTDSGANRLGADGICKPAILIADDNDDITDYIKNALSDKYSVYTARNGKTGFSLATRFVPDLIISDIMMPEMNGIEFCEKVKNDVRISHIPVILLTAKDSIGDKQAGYEAGADSYITKPFTTDILKARIQNLLESRKRILAQYVSTMSKEVENDRGKGAFSDLDRKFLDKVTDYIEDNLSSEDLDIETLAKTMGMSVSSFYRKMKGLVGISAIEYIKKIKLRKAAEMLSSGNFNVTETAWNVGINSMAYFRQWFKNEYGVTPSEFKKK